MATIEEITSLLEKFHDTKYSSPRRDINNLIISSKDYEIFLLSCYITWNEKNKTLNSQIQLLTIDDITFNKASQKLDGIINDLDKLIEVLSKLKSKIGPVTFEEVTDDLTKKVISTVDSFSTMFEIIIGKFPSDSGFSGKTLRNLKLQFTLGRWGNSSVQSAIHQAALKPLPGKKEFTYKKRNKFFYSLIGFKYQIWIISRVLFLILFYSFIQSEIAQSLLSKGIWIKIICWGMLVIWTGRSIKKRKFSVFISGVIFWGIILFWVYGLFPQNFLDSEIMRKSTKYILWLTVLFWFPVQFLNISRNNNVSQIIVLLMVWAGVLALFSYGIGKGLLIVILLFIIPVRRLFGGSKTDQQNLVGVLDKRLYKPLAISLILIALFITGEGLWLIGALIWIMFSITADHSFKYFRKNYDLIEELYPNPKGKLSRHLLLFITLTLSVALMFPGFLGQLQKEFVLSLYNQASGLAFGLITILLAVQAIIPGITTWSADTRKASRLREMRSILRANAGLEGFMQWFFILFVFSLLAWFLSSRFYTQYEILVDLSQAGIFDLPIDIIGELNRIFLLGQGISQSFMLRISTLVFGAFIYVTIYGIAQLFYLFVAANTLTLPIRDSIYSSPVEIESIKVINIEDDDEIEKKRNSHKNKLQSTDDLNGHIINQLWIYYCKEDPKSIQTIIAEFELDFVELNELLGLTKNFYSSMFMLGNVQAVKLSIVRRTYQKFRRQPVFSLEINMNEWSFIRNEMVGYPLDYKFRCLGAKLSNYTMAESQIA